MTDMDSFQTSPFPSFTTMLIKILERIFGLPEWEYQDRDTIH